MQTNTLDFTRSKTFALPKWNSAGTVTPENAVAALHRLLDSGAERAVERVVATFGEEIGVPRTREDRANHFSAWRNRLRERFAARIDEEVARELGELLDAQECGGIAQ